MKAKIQLLNGDKAGERFELQEGDALILGRDTAADVMLPERKISRKHARLYFDSDSNELLIEDLESLNGTFVNSKQIRDVEALNSGDQIRVGSFLLEVQVEGQAEAPAEDEEFSSPSVVELTGSLDTSGNSEDEAKADLGEEIHAENQFNYFSGVERLEKTSGSLISGKLEELSLPDLLQMLSTIQKSGELVVSESKIEKSTDGLKKGAATLFLEDGQILHIVYNDYENEQAFFELLKVQKGFFALFPLKHSNFDNPISMPLEALLLEGLRHLDEANAAGGDLEDEDELEPNPDQALTGLSPQELSIFQLAWKHRKVLNILAASDEDQETTRQVLLKLVRENFLNKA